VNRTFSSLRGSRNFRLYLVGMAVSATGTWINFTASSWLVLQLTDSGTALGVNAALMFGPVLFLAPFGGVLADRFDKRRILLWSQFSYAMVALVMSGLVFTDVIEIWMVYVLSVMGGIVTAIDNLRLSRLARLSGAPKVRGAGVDLFRKLGDAVSRGDPLYRVHAEYVSDLAFAREWADHDTGYTIGEPGEPPRDPAGACRANPRPGPARP